MNNTFNPPAEILFEEAPQQRFPWLNIALFALTCLTTLTIGTLLMADFTHTLGDNVGSFIREIARRPSLLLKGLPFSVAVMGILLAHEMASDVVEQGGGMDVEDLPDATHAAVRGMRGQQRVDIGP